MHSSSPNTTSEPSDQPINIPIDDMQTLFANKATKSEIKMFLYLSTFDPSGMREGQIDLPSKQEIAEFLGISTKLVRKIQVKFERLGLFKFAN